MAELTITDADPARWQQKTWRCPVEQSRRLAVAAATVGCSERDFVLNAVMKELEFVLSEAPRTSRDDRTPADFEMYRDKARKEEGA